MSAVEPSLEADVRDVSPEMLEGFDAIVHLAALSNDPLGDLDPATDVRDQSRRDDRTRSRREGRRCRAGSCSRRPAACTARPTPTSSSPRLRRSGR